MVFGLLLLKNLPPCHLYLLKNTSLYYILPHREDNELILKDGWLPNFQKGLSSLLQLYGLLQGLREENLWTIALRLFLEAVILISPSSLNLLLSQHLLYLL